MEDATMPLAIFRRPAALGLLAAGTFGLLLAGLPAEAGEHGAQRHRSQRGAGEVMQRTTTRTRTDDGWTSNTTWVRRDGRSGSSQTTVHRDPESGTRTRATVTTLPDGATRTANQTMTRTDTGMTSSTMITGPQGTTQRQTEVVRSEDGRIVTTSVTRPDGEILTRQVTVTRDPTTGTVTRQVERDGPQN
ncbi:MAG: hypothetical protein FJ191_08955 [Gammaproteobacteria bacterium]|nr:hypothetical protein [Gammaproteobacteria bacterium]